MESIRQKVSSYMQSAVAALTGIQARLYAPVRESEHVYVSDMTWSRIATASAVSGKSRSPVELPCVDGPDPGLTDAMLQ